MNCDRYSLDTGWKFALGEHGVAPTLLTHSNVYGFAKAGGAMGVASLNFDDGGWQTVDLPHDWLHLQPFDPEAAPNLGYKKGGWGCYRRKFRLEPEDASAAIRIEFDGIAGISEVYFNGSQLHHNKSGYNSFYVDITDVANFGITPNILTVRVDARLWEGWWYEGGGIYRHVWLTKSPPMRISYNGIWACPVTQGSSLQSWRLELRAELENMFPEVQEYSLDWELIDPEGDPASRTEQQGSLGGYSVDTASKTLCVENPLLWSCVHPWLYTLRITLRVGESEETRQIRVGFRHIQVNADNGFFLNGKPLKLLGTCNHQDHAGVGVAVPDAIQRHRLERLKEMGCNAYRCAHNPPSPELLDFCDEMGILVMDENRALNTSRESLDMVESLVKRDRNHPSVVMYSVFNEEPLQGTPRGRRLASRLGAAIHKLDTTRPVVGCLNGGFMEETGASLALDVTGINYFPDSFDEFHRRYPSQPLVSSELVSAYATRDNSVTDKTTQVFDNFDGNAAAWGQSVREANRAVLERPFVMGMFVWTGFDYRGEPSPYVWPSVSSHFGTLDTCGFPKDSYYLYQAYWKKQPVLHITGSWNHLEGERVRLMSFSNCEEVELQLNGRSLGRRANPIYEQLVWEMEYELGCVVATGYKGGELVAQDKLETYGAPHHLLLRPSKTELYSDTCDAVAVDIVAVDAEGRQVTNAAFRLAFSVEGGRLLGAGNGDPNSHEVDDATEHSMFHGRCQVILSSLEPGTLQLSVRSDKTEEAMLALKVKENPDWKVIQPVWSSILAGWQVSHQALAKRPDPCQIFDESDMNTLEPVVLEGNPLSQLDGRRDFFVLYRTRLDLGCPRVGRYLVFTRACGKVELFCNGEKAGEVDLTMPGRWEVLLPERLTGLCDIRVVLQNTGLDGVGGLLEPVELAEME